MDRLTEFARAIPIPRGICVLWITIPLYQEISINDVTQRFVSWDCIPYGIASKKLKEDTTLLSGFMKHWQWQN